MRSDPSELKTLFHGIATLVQISHFAYCPTVILRPGTIRAICLLMACLSLRAAAAGKPVRLRTGEVQTPSRSQAYAKGNSQRVHGLYLIQFEAGVSPAWRKELGSLGVRLLQYVPEDAFVIRLQGAVPADLLALPYVRWLEPYTAVQRVDPRLRNPADPRVTNRRGHDVEAPRVALVLAADAPVDEVEQVLSMFRERPAQERHRFGTVVQGFLRPGRLAEAAVSPAVLWIEPSDPIRLSDESASAVVGGPATNHMTFSQQLGFDGAGVTVAVVDSGLDNGLVVNRTDLLGRTKAVLFYGGLANGADEHGHGTHVAGIIAGRGITLEGDEFGYYGLGVAPGAQLVAQRVFDANGDFRSVARETLTRDAVRNGAVIGNNSWTVEAQGHYDVGAQQFDDLVRDADFDTPGDQPYLMVFAAGNAGPGPHTIGSPALGKNVIAVGASQGPRSGFLSYDDGIGALANPSSRGPCDDGRIKPDLVAPGTWIASLLSVSGQVERATAPINNEFVFMSGTSQASPHVAGAAAVFVQYYRSTHDGNTPSPAMIKAALINSAVDLNGSSAAAPAPNHDEGWGRANVARLVQPDRGFEFVDQAVPLMTGQVYERTVFVAATNCPLNITLAYTDYPGFPGALPALVNDLDLELTGPDGRVFRGNQFAQGQSVPGAVARDTINNVEGIRIDVPMAGEYRLQVRAQRVSQDSRQDTAAVDQDFALVISGGLPAPGEGIVVVDRTAYRAPDRIQVKLFDSGLSGQQSARVTIRSRTETNGESVALLRSGAGVTFTGAVATATGPVVIGDSVLQLAHGDWICVEKVDIGPASIRTASAVADLRPPVISAVGPTNALGQQSIAWTTDEPSSSSVRYGTSASDLNRAVTNSALTRAHVLELSGLVPGVLYHFEVTSADAAGNVATNDPAAPPGSFTAIRTATVLLVDAYQPSPPDPVIPLSSYTGPLAELGMSYDVWSLAELQSLPDLDALRRYPVVVWRLNDSASRPNDGIPPSQQEAIEHYLNAGGSFFLASMNVLSRLLRQNAGEFVTNVLHVQRFTLNANHFDHCTNCDEDFRVPRAMGVASDPFSQGLDLVLDYSGYPMDGLMGPDFGDTFRPTTNARPFLVEAVSGKACGVRCPKSGDVGPGRVVFLSVPFDAVPDTGDMPNGRTDLLRRVMRFLAPGLGGVGTLALGKGAYAIPDIISVELADSDLEGLGTVAVSVGSDTVPAPMTIVLSETTHPGLFRGAIPLAATEMSGTLQASHGDRVRVKYHDVSLGTEIEASAVVDAAPADLSDVAVRAGYFDASISWNTTEPTDALIQFGESAFLDGTVHRSELQTNHTLRLIGLVPGRPYFFKITVRDEAGNLTVSDNNGEFHSFETRVALQASPTIFENFEDASAPDRWTVLASEDSQAQWSLGSPNDGQTAMPYSGANAWASNIYGDPADIIDTYLISPGIDLRAANVAQLKFKQSYKFLDLTGFDYVREGRLLISTNVQRDPVVLASYTESTFDWTEETIDLTPYAGKTVFLIWHHQMRSATLVAPEQRSGWAIDDVRVTARNVPAGSILVTNNLSQARFTVRRGGMLRSGHGLSQIFTNLPPDSYEVKFEPVPYFVTPEPSTNGLVAGVTNRMGGVYTMVDVNANGMSDAWEMARFGAVAPDRTRQTDTDGDGFTDLAEFYAGTDPNQPNSVLAIAKPLVLSGPLLRFQWPSTAGRSYQLQGWDGVHDWIPMSSWIRASSDTATVIIPPPAEGDPHMFRVEVQP